MLNQILKCFRRCFSKKKTSLSIDLLSPTNENSSIQVVTAQKFDKKSGGLETVYEIQC